VDEGVIGGWQGRRAGIKTYSASPGTVTASPPLVLVDRSTLGVGEVLASALQRHGAIVVGQKTAGHAPHMDLVRDGEVAVWMPVGEWLAADEKPISDTGIEPDEMVESSDADAENDPILSRALALLSRELPKAA
jgi:C-terminal processing protease CtpA/Prc